jgi:hypothetical protein
MSRHDESLDGGLIADIPKSKAVKYKYALHPLGTNTSLTDLVGRFNVGGIEILARPFGAEGMATAKSEDNGTRG